MHDGVRFSVLQLSRIVKPQHHTLEKKEEGKLAS